jgi:hypothetical protein
MEEINEIASKAYHCAVRRGKITNDYSYKDFMWNLGVELMKLADAEHKGKECISEKLSYVIITCLAMTIYYDINLWKSLDDAMYFNEEGEVDGE